MADVLIRGLSDQALELIDQRAARLGISRNEFLRRRFEQDVQADDDLRPTTADDLRRSAAAFADLADPDVMADAWR